MTERHFDDSWKIWIWSNVARGCSKDEVFKILLDNGFDFDAIQKELNHVPTAELDSIVVSQADSTTRANPHYIANSRKAESDRIELYVLEDFLTEEECNGLVALMKPRLRDSTITNENEPDAYFRTSKTCDFAHMDDPLSKEVDRRICRTLGINPSYSEGMQGQMYEIGEEFKPHTDWFSPGTEEFERFGGKQGQRTWTFMIYLNDVEEGGETHFENVGIMAKPSAGTAIFWNNLYADGTPNPDTKHHALPVKAGYKAVITKWFRSHGEGEASIRTGAESVPNFTREGFKKLRFDDDVTRELQAFLSAGRHSEEKEYQSLDFLSNDEVHPTTMVELPEELKNKAANAVKSHIEAWADEKVDFTCVYGIRCYRRGTTLGMHTDRVETHILSAIVNIEQDVDEPWPLEIEDHHYRTHRVYLEPGEMLLYESARLLHGRATPLNGNSYCNIFVHFRPSSDAWRVQPEH